jgi:hypothetical protein
MILEMLQSQKTKEKGRFRGFDVSQYIAVDIFWVSHAVLPSNPFIQHANAKYLVFNVVFQFDRLTQILLFLSFSFFTSTHALQNTKKATSI